MIDITNICVNEEVISEITVTILINTNLMSLVTTCENELKTDFFVVRKNQDRYLRVKVGNGFNKLYKAVIADQ